MFGKKGNVPVSTKNQNRELNNFRSEFNTLVDRFFNDWNSPFDEEWTKKFVPSLNIKENDSSYVVETELPGVKKEDINVTMKENSLVIQGEKKAEVNEKKDQYHYMERSFGQFYREIPLPQDVDREKVEANLDNGVLKLELAKSDKAKSTKRQIQIK